MIIDPAWDYQTRAVTDFTEEEILREVGEEGWEPAAHSAVFHYFKRQRGIRAMHAINEAMP